MPVVRFHCPFVGLNRCQDGSGNGTKTSLITPLHDQHCSGEVQGSILFGLSVIIATVQIFSHPYYGDGVVQFMLYDLTKPRVPSCIKQLDHVDDRVHDLHGDFTSL
ncbi:hypothetical protein Tco_0396431 [Tanacetum coccineum]